MPEPQAQPEVRVRPYRDSDAVAVRSLNDRTPLTGCPPSPGPQAWPPDLDDIPRQFKAFCVAEVEGEIAGVAGLVAEAEDVPTPVLATIGRREDAVRLTRMRIAPEWQRRGLGLASSRRC